MMDETKYGFCKRTQAWVPRDSMQGIGIRVYYPDGTEENFTLRFAPEAHTDFVERARALEWDRVLKTRAELEAMGAPIEALELPTLSDTAVWYRSRHGVDEDSEIVARASLRALRLASDLPMQAAAIRTAATKCTPEALMTALRDTSVRRWDHGVAADVDPVDILQMEFGRRLHHVVDAIAVSADLDEVLIVAVVQHGGGQTVMVETLDHGRSELAHRKAGKLADEAAVIDERDTWNV